MVKENFNQNLTDGQKHLGQQLLDAINIHVSPTDESKLEKCITKVKELLKQGAPVNFQDPDTKMTALHHAVHLSSVSYYLGKQDIAEILLDHKDIDCLIRDKYKRLPIHMTNSDLVTNLHEKTAEQAKERGIIVHEKYDEVIGESIEQKVKEFAAEMRAKGIPVSKPDLEEYADALDGDYHEEEVKRTFERKLRRNYNPPDKTSPGGID